MTGPQQFWESVHGAASEAAPESSAVVHVYRFTLEQFAARLGIVLPDGARITDIERTTAQFDDYGKFGSATVKITVENKLRNTS